MNWVRGEGMMDDGWMDVVLKMTFINPAVGKFVFPLSLLGTKVSVGAKR